MNEIISSYPNKYYKSKHERFAKYVICACECDCDMIVTMIGLKKGDMCNVCKEGDHANPVYARENWRKINGKN